MKIINMKKGDWGVRKAYFSLETDEGIIIKNFKLVDSNTGLYVNVPSTLSRKDNKWYEDVTIPEKLKEIIKEKALKKYYEE